MKVKKLEDLRLKEGRGKFLTVVLILYGISLFDSVATVLRLLSDHSLLINTAQFYHVPSIHILMMNVYGIFLTVLVVLGILAWRRNYIIVYLVLNLFGAFIDALYFKMSYLALYKVIPPGMILTGQLIFFFLMVWVFKRKWHLFE